MALTKVSYSMITGAVVNIKDFGAVGDGTTDDSAAIQAAINSTNDFIQVYMPPGTYRLSSPIIVDRQNMSLFGAAQQTTLYPDAGVTAIEIAKNNGVSRTQLRDFRIYGNTNATGGISLGGDFVAFCQIQNLVILNFLATGSFGIKLSKVQELDIDNCYIADNYNNIHFPDVGSNYATSVHIHGQGGYIGRATNIGILLDREVASFMVSDIVIESNDVGFACTGFSNQVTFDNVHFEENDGANAIFLAGDASRAGQFTIRNCFFFGNTINLRAEYAYIMCENNTGFAESGKFVFGTGVNIYFANNKADDGVSTNPIPLYEAMRSAATVSYIDKDNNGRVFERVDQLYIGAGAATLISGPGAPEGFVVAAIGSLYLRTDGGAGTTLYVKESGTGNTGWIGK